MPVWFIRSTLCTTQEKIIRQTNARTMWERTFQERRGKRRREIVRGSSIDHEFTEKFIPATFIRRCHEKPLNFSRFSSLRPPFLTFRCKRPLQIVGPAVSYARRCNRRGKNYGGLLGQLAGPLWMKLIQIQSKTSDKNL